jgi:RNA polymerase sigma factor (sigma-70 family)
MITDERLMSNYLNGSVSAFEELYRRHRQRVLEMALRHTGDPPHSEQIVQMVFKRFHKTRLRHELRYSVSHHLFVITRHEIMQFLKRTRRFNPEEWADPAGAPKRPADAEPMEFSQEVKRQMEQLTPEAMDSLSIRFQDGLAFEEIAHKLGIPWSAT